MVARPTRVSVAAGRVRVPEAVAEASRTVVPDVVPATINLPTLPAAPKVLAPVTVSALPKVIAVPLEAGPVNVTPFGIVRVAPVAGAVIVTLLMVVAEATPRVGVVRVGEVENTAEPEPVSSVTAEARLEDEHDPTATVAVLLAPASVMVVQLPAVRALSEESDPELPIVTKAPVAGATPEPRLLITRHSSLDW